MKLDDVMAAMTAAGFSNEQMGAMVRALSSIPARSGNAERQARFRQRKRELSAHNVTSDVTDNVTVTVTNDAESVTPHASAPTPVLYGEEVKDTSSLRSEGADAPESVTPESEKTVIYEDAKHELWGRAPSLLTDLGVASSQARPVIGRMLKRAGDQHALVLDKIVRAWQQRPVDPVPWIMRALPEARAGPSINGYHARKTSTGVLQEMSREQPNNSGFDFEQSPGSSGAIIDGTVVEEHFGDGRNRRQT